MERLGAAVILVAFAASFPLHPFRMWNIHPGDAVIDLALTLFFAWLALNRDRWWPLVMSAVMALTVMVHVTMFAVPTLDGFADLSARIGLGILMALTLLASVGERWLAGEPAVSDRRTWRRRPDMPTGSAGHHGSRGSEPSRSSI